MGSGTAKPSSSEHVKKLKDSSSILADELHKPVIKKFNKKSIFAI